MIFFVLSEQSDFSFVGISFFQLKFLICLLIIAIFASSVKVKKKNPFLNFIKLNVWISSGAAVSNCYSLKIPQPWCNSWIPNDLDVKCICCRSIKNLSSSQFFIFLFSSNFSGSLKFFLLVRFSCNDCDLSVCTRTWI